MMTVVVRRVKGGWAVFSCGHRITKAMSRSKARQIRRHMASELMAMAA